MIPELTKTKIIDFLERQETYTNVEIILRFLRMDGISISRRTLRLIFEEMLMKDEVLIVRSNKGIKLVRGENDFNELVDSYKEQAKTLAIEGNKAIQVWNKRHFSNVPQLELDFNW